ncbi:MULTISPECIES: hypothetical protein [Acidiplasma]|jgi:hypothetical protein|uniref:ABC-2 type transporter domain-containing protein n=1 Tax=Acidiplasma aeolicum TaxID=507754 RepID=A0A0Q1B2C4_9ARCH|nr:MULTISPECIES: hypothetical protein [Acidiplasma]KQB33923.1 hypothetical protein AOG54_06135 [Acidiplasma aeolicum]
MISTLYKIGIISYFKNRNSLFWSFGFVLVWVLIYAYGFPAPSGTYLKYTESTYISFILLFGISVSMASVVFYTVSMNLSIPYITRFDRVKSYEVSFSNILSSLTFSMVVGIFAIIFSLLIFRLRFSSVYIKNIYMLIFILIVISLFFTLLGLLFSYLLSLLNQVGSLKFISQIPMILTFILVLGLQIFRKPGPDLIYYSPFNAMFTIIIYSLTGKAGINYYHSGLNTNLLLISTLIWILSMVILVYVLEKLYETSGKRNQYTLEDIFK